MKTITIQISRLPASQPPMVVTHGVVKSSHDFYGMDRVSWNEVNNGKIPPAKDVSGLPDAWRFAERDSFDKPEFIELDENLQHWLLRSQLEMWKGRRYTKAEYFVWWEDGASAVERDWLVNELTGALTSDRYSVNYVGMDNGANYLKGERTDGQKPKWIKIMSGWACLLLSMEIDGVTPKIRNVGGNPCYGFPCIDASQDVWLHSPLDPAERHLWDRNPMITGRILAIDKGGLYIVRNDIHIPFPQVNELLTFPIMLPEDGIGWIPVMWVTPSDGFREKVWIR